MAFNYKSKGCGFEETRFSAGGADGSFGSARHVGWLLLLFGKDAGFDKYRYQVDAVAQAVRKIEQYNGVIIADVVGLGKSIIASLTGAMRRRRGLIICPPGLIGSPKGDAGGWYEYIYKFGLKDWKIWSRGDLEGVTEMLKHDPDFDMVVVDEAHNFRNEGTEDYGLLANICFGRETVLLTATPFNNRPNMTFLGIRHE